MSEKFANAILNTSSRENRLGPTFTENGALAYRGAASALVDINYRIAEFRPQWKKGQELPDFAKGPLVDNIMKAWKPAYREDPALALRWLFFASDVREGLGERFLFRAISRKLNPLLLCELIKTRGPDGNPLIAFYSRWDNIFVLYTMKEKDKPLKPEEVMINKVIIQVIKEQLAIDLKNLKEDKPISLMAKWIPSQSRSDPDKVRMANRFAKELHLKPIEYQKAIGQLKKKLDLVEIKMCARQWDQIEYPKVPAKAMKLYKRAFFRHDEVDGNRNFHRFLENVEDGKEKIHAGTLFPYEIIHDILCSRGNKERIRVDEAQWKALPLIKNPRRTFVIPDGSGSMLATIGSVTRLEVAMAFAILFSENMRGPFKDLFMTFSENPRMVDLSSCKSLEEKVYECKKYNEVANTNIKRAMDLILRTAIANNCSQDDLPEDLLILSDMQFDEGCDDAQYCLESGRYNSWEDRKVDYKKLGTLFEEIQEDFKRHGYKMPRIIFWNLAGSNSNVPMQSNEAGVVLIGGFSQNAYRMVVNGITDPYEALKDVLMIERYDPIEKVFRSRREWNWNPNKKKTYTNRNQPYRGKGSDPRYNKSKNAPARNTPESKGRRVVNSVLKKLGG